MGCFLDWDEVQKLYFGRLLKMKNGMEAPSYYETIPVVGQPAGCKIILMPLVAPADHLGWGSNDLRWSAGSECGNR